MKTMKSVLAAGVALLLLAGCATTFKPWKLSEIQEGMSRDQVVQILGNPDYTVNKNGAEYLYYSYQEELTPINEGSLNNDAAIERRVEQITNTFKDYKYEVMVVEGKVVNYKELTD